MLPVRITQSRIVICLRQIAFVPNAGQAMLVPAAENDRFRFFRRGSVVDPCGRVDTRPYAGLAVVRRARRYAPLRGAGGRRRARGYAPLRGAAFRNVGAANFNPPAGRPQILNSPFSILNSAAGRRPESGRPTHDSERRPESGRPTHDSERRPGVRPPYARFKPIIPNLYSLIPDP